VAKDIKQTLDGWIDYSSPKLGTFLTRTWKNQQQALTYKEIREAIQNGQLDISYLSQWRQDYSKFIINGYAPLAQQAIDNSVKAVTSQFGVGAKILQNQYIDNFISSRGGKLIREVTQEQYKAINVLVRQATMSEGMDVQELAKAIRPTVGLTQRQSMAAFHRYEQAKKDGYSEDEARQQQAAYAEKLHRQRAETIAITEMAYAYNYGQQAYMEQCIKDGTIGGCQKEWITALDERVCDICGSLDKKVVEMDEDFIAGGITVPVPPAHPRCRCVCNYVNVLPPADWVDTSINTQSSAAPDDVEIPDDFDWSKTGMDYKGLAHLGGTGEMHIVEDSPSGEEFLFKPAQSKNGTEEDFRAYVQEAGYKVQGIIDPDSAVVVGTGYVDIPGRGNTFGAAQLRIQNVDGTFDLEAWQLHGGTLDPNIVAQLQRENVTDWLLGNYDCHGRNFVLTTDGRLIGVDKEQSFRYINASGAQTMSLNYHPNSIYHETEPVYNTLYRRFANGEIDIKLNDTLAYIKRIEAVSDADYREIFRPYAEALKGKGPSAELLLDQIVSRKQNVRATFENFYSELLTQRKGTKVQFQFADNGQSLMYQAKSPLTNTFSVATLKTMKLADLHQLAKAQGIKNFGIMHKDEIITCLSDPSKIQQIHDTATERARLIGQARKTKQTGQAGNARTLEGIPQVSDAIKNPDAVLQTAGPRGVALIGDATALEGMEATMRRVSIDGEEYIELTGKMTQTRWEQALNNMNSSQSGSYWRYNQGVGNIDYTQPVLNLSSGTEKISLGTRYIRNGDDILIVAGSDAASSQRALMGQFNIRVKAGPDAGMRIQALINQAGIGDVTAEATVDALDKYKKMRLLWQTDPKTATGLDPTTVTDTQLTLALNRAGITQARIDAVKVKQIQEGYWTLVDPENKAIADRTGVAYIYHQIFDESAVAPVLKSGELLATTNRWNRGIVNSGMSSSTDVRTGGADSVFTRVVFKDHIGTDTLYSSHAVTFVFDKDILERTDWYAYGRDTYGKTDDYNMSSRRGTEEFLNKLKNSYNGSNEIMFRKTVPLMKDLKEIRVRTDYDRQSLLDSLKQEGITRYNGVIIEDFVKVGGGKL